MIDICKMCVGLVSFALTFAAVLRVIEYAAGY